MVQLWITKAQSDQIYLNRQFRQSSKIWPDFPIHGHRLLGFIFVFGTRRTSRWPSSITILAMLRVSSIPLCCRPSKAGKPRTFSWAGIFMDRRFRVSECVLEVHQMTKDLTSRTSPWIQAGIFICDIKHCLTTKSRMSNGPSLHQQNRTSRCPVFASMSPFLTKNASSLTNASGNSGAVSTCDWRLISIGERGKIMNRPEWYPSVVYKMKTA